MNAIFPKRHSSYPEAIHCFGRLYKSVKGRDIPIREFIHPIYSGLTPELVNTFSILIGEIPEYRITLYILLLDLLNQV